MVIEHIEISGSNLSPNHAAVSSADDISNSLTSIALIEQLTASLHAEVVRLQTEPKMLEQVAA